MKNQNAFTLIEMLLYLALTAIFLGGILGCVYGLVAWTQDDAARMELLDESNFLAARILWTFFGAKDFSLQVNPAMFANLISPEVTLKNLSFDGLTVSFELQTRSRSGRLMDQQTNFNLYLEK